MNLLLVLLPALAVLGCQENATGGADETGAELAANALAPPRDASSPAPPMPGRADAIPAAFHGVYDASVAGCRRPSEYRLAVSARELRFHESAGTVRGVTIERPDSIRVAAEYRGEGESWSAVRQLRLSDQGARLTVTGDGVETVRVRCGVPPAPEPSTRWNAAANGEGAVLFLADRDGTRALTFYCPAGSGDLLVNVPAFRPVASEERMSVGAGGIVVALVADFRGDRQRGGVSGTGPLPDELPDILRGRVAVNYGAQNAGPFAPPPQQLAGDFLAGCRG